MKKRIIGGIILGMFVTTGLTGCGSSTKEGKVKENKENVVEEVEEDEVEEVEEINYDNGLTYEDFARDVDGLKGEYLTLAGKVVQVMETGNTTELRVAVGGDCNKIIYCVLKNKNIKILEDDYIKIKGQSIGYVEYTTVLNTEKSVVGVDVHELVISSVEECTEQINSVLVDNEVVKITLNNITDDYSDKDINVTIENKTQENITIEIDNVVIDGYTIDGYLYSKVNAGTKMNDAISLYDMKDDINNLSTTFEVINSNYDTIGEYSVSWAK